MRMWDVVHPGRIMPPNNCTIRIGGRHVLLLRLEALLGILGGLLLIGLPVLWDGVRGVDVEWRRRVKMRSRSG